MVDKTPTQFPNILKMATRCSCAAAKCERKLVQKQRRALQSIYTSEQQRNIIVAGTWLKKKCY